MVSTKGSGSTAPEARIAEVAVEADPTWRPIQLLTGMQADTATATKWVMAANLSWQTCVIDGEAMYKWV